MNGTEYNCYGGYTTTSTSLPAIILLWAINGTFTTTERPLYLFFCVLFFTLGDDILPSVLFCNCWALYYFTFFLFNACALFFFSCSALGYQANYPILHMWWVQAATLSLWRVSHRESVVMALSNYICLWWSFLAVPKIFTIFICTRPILTW